MTNNAEFSLHIHKKAGDARRPALYTIGVWEATVQRAICHIQPIKDALVAIRSLLDEADRSPVGKPCSQDCHSIQTTALSISTLLAPTAASPRLVLEAYCPSCGREWDENAEPVTVLVSVFAHITATAHVVVLNGTADFPARTSS